jgi:hypothetical protein
MVGRDPTGQALVASDGAQEVSTLTGFDPSRIAALNERVRNMQVTEHHPKMAEFWGEIAAGFESLLAEMERRDENERQNCLNWGPCTRMNRAALHQTEIDAIAMEARRGATTGATAEGGDGAGPKDIAQ